MEIHNITYIVPYLYTYKMKFVTLACEMIMNFLVNREHFFDGFNYITIYKLEHQHWQFEYINLKTDNIWSDWNNGADSDLYGEEVINLIARLWSFRIDNTFFLLYLPRHRCNTQYKDG